MAARRTFAFLFARSLTRSRRTSCRSCSAPPRSVRSSGQSERAGARRGAALDAPAQPPLLIARAWVDLAAMSSDLVDERRPLLRADVSNPSTHDAVGTIVFSIVATGERARPFRLANARPSRQSRCANARRARRSIGRANASPSRRARRPRAACARRRRGRRARGRGRSRRGRSAARCAELHRRRHADGSTSGTSCAPTIVTSGRSCQVPGRPQSGARGLGESFVAKEANLVYPGRADRTLPGRPDVRRRRDEHGGGARAAEARAERAAADDAPVAEHADLAKLRPRRAVQECTRRTA